MTLESNYKIQLYLQSESPFTCNAAGSNPIGTETSTVDVYNNTRVQVAYYNSAGLSRLVDAGYLPSGYVHVQPLDTENRMVEFWLSCVCVDDYASSASPTKLTLELPAATSSSASDIYTAPPTQSRPSTAAVMSVGTLVIVCLTLRDAACQLSPAKHQLLVASAEDTAGVQSRDRPLAVKHHQRAHKRRKVSTQ
ncbi:hypothetical protein PROFUN_10275 [Planoprotostelium fungivorum]|uniref:Uncharacterized protein n=1 Tax=Planoprotostelium fungivorum TaxID=1890364 RepID=A0A2P6MRQ0_9EUKA|nr:hypothetical protein PROFUN_10275 [Planoprotostelium fungivorum]